MAHLETLEAKMASIEVSLSTAAYRRRKWASIGGGSISSRSSLQLRPESAASKDSSSTLQGRHKLLHHNDADPTTPVPSSPLTEMDAQLKLTHLKREMENKKTTIQNLRQTIEKLYITDNIDSRIRQAELEYALGREELHLLSLSEEITALEDRLEKPKPQENTIFYIVKSDANLQFLAVSVTVGRWFASQKPDIPGLWVEWALEGEQIYRGDRILEINGKLVINPTKVALQKILESQNDRKCQLVVVRRKTTPPPPPPQIQEENLRLQHRISYLEEQVKELQTKENDANDKDMGHVTRISIHSHPKRAIQSNGFDEINHQHHLQAAQSLQSLNKIKRRITKSISKDLQNNKRLSSSSNYDNNQNSISSTSIAIKNDSSVSSSSTTATTETPRWNRVQRQFYTNGALESLQKGTLEGQLQYHNNHKGYNYTRSVEYLNQSHSNGDSKTQRYIASHRRAANNHHSMNNFYFKNDTDGNATDCASEPIDSRARPNPPKKPLRLSLQRVQSLQSVEVTAGKFEDEKKKSSLKVIYKDDNGKSIGAMQQYIENGLPNGRHTLKRSKPV